MMDYDDAYSNGAYIPDSECFPPRWALLSSAYRDSTPCNLDIPYGQTGRQVLDVFHPNGASQGTLVFIHGGYWSAFDKSSWSHLAQGANEAGWTVAIPSYDLCPAIGIDGIAKQMIAAMRQIALMTTGAIRISGHSAGGHLAARTTDPRINEPWQERVDRVMPISPLSDLEPLTHTTMNGDLGLTKETAFSESPIHQPMPNCDVITWVGADERPAFLDQARWLKDAWDCRLHIAPGRHHFDVIDDLTDASSEMIKLLLKA